MTSSTNPVAPGPPAVSPGISPAESTAASPAAQLTARLDEPAVAAALNNVLDHADLLALLVVALDGFVARSEVIGDALTTSINELRSASEAPNNPFRGLDAAALATSLKTLATTVPRVTPAVATVVDSGLIEELLSSGITDPEVIDQVGRLGRGLAKGAAGAATDPIRITGPVALTRVLRDPDIGRGLGFFLNVLKSMGAELGAPNRSRAGMSSPEKS